MCTPNCESEDTLKSNAKMMGLAKILNRACSKTGLLRLADFYQSGTLTDGEKKKFTEIACHITANDTIIKERDFDSIIALNNELHSSPLPTVPMIMYVSKDYGGSELWVDGMQAMADAMFTTLSTSG